MRWRNDKEHRIVTLRGWAKGPGNSFARKIVIHLISMDTNG